MSRFSTVLENQSSDTQLFDLGSARIAAESKSDKPQVSYDKLAVTLFRPKAEGAHAVILVCSAQQGAGVSSIVRGVANSLARNGRSVGLFDQDLRRLPIKDDPDVSGSSQDRALLLGTPTVLKMPATPESLESLRNRLECVLIDCGSVEENSGLTHLAASCDGVLLVAEAGRSSRKMLKHAQQSIERARGKLIGVVLNKRRYPIPAWLYKILHVS